MRSIKSDVHKARYAMKDKYHTWYQEFSYFRCAISVCEMGIAFHKMQPSEMSIIAAGLPKSRRNTSVELDT